MAEHISKSIMARPSGYWNNTGVQVGENDHVTVAYASGSWTSNPYWQTNDAAGTSQYLGEDGAGLMRYLLIGAPQGALIGKIGGSSEPYDGGPAFLVGNLASVPAGEVGTLWLSVNDAPAGFGDNSGTITVQISKN